MSGAVGQKKRLIRITDGNVRHSHLYVANHLDFFPPDIVGPPQLEEELNGRGIVIHLDGLNETVKTDIGSEPSNGRPRRMFRQRAWVGRFFRHHKLKGGDLLALEKIAAREYRLYPYGANSDRDHGWREWLDTPPPGIGPTVIELFAGCGGMALGFKNANFRTVLANEWDAAACDTLRANITDRVAQCAI